MMWDSFSDYLIETTPANASAKKVSCQLETGIALKDPDLPDLEQRVMADCENGKKYDRRSSTYGILHNRILRQNRNAKSASVSNFLRKSLYNLYEEYLEYKSRMQEIVKASSPQQ